jgi:hypothetical protein
MSLFEEYLTLGYWLAEEERLALYKYLLISKKATYLENAKILLTEGSIKTSFANGDLVYILSTSNNSVSCMTRKRNTVKYSEEIRSIRLLPFKSLNTPRLVHFFAQAEVDVLRNFPIPSLKENREGGYSTNFYPFYDLNYYSNGRGKIIGFIKKLQAKDDELLEKLLAS